MFEKHHEELIPRRAFIRRLLIHAAMAGGVAFLVLAIGMFGYRTLDGRSLSEAFVHAAAPLSGMGVTHVPDHSAGQIFTGIYAVLASFAFVLVSAILYVPVLHRILHAFHLRQDPDEEAEEEGASGGRKPKDEGSGKDGGGEKIEDPTIGD